MREIKNHLGGHDPNFTYRGLNQTRIETFSDAVFAFAVTLVILSSSVPESFAQLKESFRDILPFFLCVVLIVVIWYQHYIFFIRYGLQDVKTVVINTFSLFVLLIYVYPLKFLMTLLFELYRSIIIDDFTRFNEQYAKDMDASFLMTSYGFGAAIIFCSLALLYRHAYKRRVDLELSQYEIYLTKISIWTNLLLGSIPFLSGLIAFIEPFGSDQINFVVAGFTYFLSSPVMTIFGSRMRKKAKSLLV